MKRAIVDIETNNLSANIIHCIVAHSYDGSTEKVWIGDECLQFGDWSKQIDQFIMHNGISFDAPVLNKLTGSIIKLNQISRNKNLDKLMINFLTQCNISDYQPIYSYIISENTEIDKNIRVRMIKLILHFRKLLIQQLKKGHQNIQNKSVRKIIETLNLLFT